MACCALALLFDTGHHREPQEETSSAVLASALRDSPGALGPRAPLLEETMSFKKGIAFLAMLLLLLAAACGGGESGSTSRPSTNITKHGMGRTLCLAASARF